MLLAENEIRPIEPHDPCTWYRDANGTDFRILETPRRIFQSGKDREERSLHVAYVELPDGRTATHVWDYKKLKKRPNWLMRAIRRVLP